MNITVVLCTHNRCEALAKALRSVAMSKVPESLGWEVLVVDNNSDDQTRNVVDEYCTEFPGRFRYLFESQPGKSHALNSGIEAARGQLLAFMDDDIIVELMWLQNLTARLHDRKWAGCGGHPSAMDLRSTFVATTRLGASRPIRYRSPGWTTYRVPIWHEHGLSKRDV